VAAVWRRRRDQAAPRRLLLSLPSFFLGLVLMLVFSVEPGAPLAGNATWRHAVLPAGRALPAAAWSAHGGGSLSRSEQDYIRTARQGLTEWVWNSHAEECLVPVVTVGAPAHYSSAAPSSPRPSLKGTTADRPVDRRATSVVWAAVLLLW
jgi:hypothetical protein